MSTQRSVFSSISLLLACVAVSLIGAAMYTPSLPAIAADFGSSVATVQLTVTVYLIGFAAAQLFVGALSDRLGRKPVFVVGFLLFVAASAACAAAPDVETLIVLRFLQSLGASVGIVVSRAVVGDWFGGSESARYMAYLGMATGLTPALSPMLGGLIEVSVGWRGVFYTMVVMGVAALLAVLLWFRESHPSHSRTQAGPMAMLSGFAVLIRNRRFLAYSTPAAASAAIFFIFLAAGPVVMIGDQGVTPDVYGFYAVCMPGGYIVGNFMSSRMLPHIGIDRGIVIGSAVTVAAALGMTLLGLAGHFSPLAFALALSGIGLGNGIVVPAAYAGVVGTDPRIAGTASGLSGFLQFATAAAVNPLAGLARHGSLTELAGVLLALSVVASVGYAGLRVRDERDPFTTSP